MGTWIEMYCPCQMNTPCYRRSLQWERGLKQEGFRREVMMVQSFPAMGTWIEISNIIYPISTTDRRSLQWERGLKCLLHLYTPALFLSFPAMGTWIEMKPDYPTTSRLESSFPAMGTWIEIEVIADMDAGQVVPCNGNVD